MDDDRIVIRNGPFEEEVDDIVAEIRRRQPRAGRAIFLLDQTGYSQVELALVERILAKLLAAEVIMTFAADGLTNYLAETPSRVKAVEPLGLTDAQILDLIQHRNGAGGRAVIQRTLRDHIRACTGATFDTPFFIRPQQSRRALWFLHLSRHPTARDVMIQRHWEIHNTFEHYGPGDFGMLGWDALKNPEQLPLFNFGERDAVHVREKLLDSMPKKLFSLASDEPVTVDAMRYMFANETAVPFSELDKVVLQLSKEREIDVLAPDGKVRSRVLTKLQPTDRIAFPATLLLPGIARLR